MPFNPTLTDSHECPKCSEKNEWKHPKVIVMEGTIIVDTGSDGGGFGSEIGIGRGQGGISVKYQGITFKTTGTQTSSMAAAYFPPDEPNDYVKKDYWIKVTKDAVDTAAKIVQEMAVLGKKGESPSIIFGPSDSKIKNSEKSYHDARRMMELLAKYEVALEVWERSRVCSRCGTAYITQHEYASITHEIKIPSPQFNFSDIDCHCQCGSYLWINAQAYYQKKTAIDDKYGLTVLDQRIQQAEEYLVKAKGRLSKAETEAHGRSFFYRLKNKFYSLDPVALRQEALAVEAGLAKSKEQRSTLVEQFNKGMTELKVRNDSDPDFAWRRFCEKCHRSYVIR